MHDQGLSRRCCHGSTAHQLPTWQQTSRQQGSSALTVCVALGPHLAHCVNKLRALQLSQCFMILQSRSTQLWRVLQAHTRTQGAPALPPRPPASCLSLASVVQSYVFWVLPSAQVWLE